MHSSENGAADDNDPQSNQATPNATSGDGDRLSMSPGRFIGSADATISPRRK